MAADLAAERLSRGAPDRRQAAAAQLAFHELERGRRSQAQQVQLAALAPQEPVCRRAHEQALWRAVKDPLELLARDSDVVEHDQRARLGEVLGELGRGGREDDVALVHGLENELQDVLDGLPAAGGEHDSLGRMAVGAVRDVAKQRGLADPGLARDLDRETGIKGSADGRDVGLASQEVRKVGGGAKPGPSACGSSGRASGAV